MKQATSNKLNQIDLKQRTTGRQAAKVKINWLTTG
jgi:hypothetical protein